MQLLSQTRTSQIRERGIYGQTVLDLHQQLSRIIERRTGNREYAALFAVPSHNRVTGEILWYTEQLGPVLSWREMSQEERSRSRQGINSAVAAILELAREHRESGNRVQPADADAFFAALGFDAASSTCQIDYEKSYTVGGVPVLTEWGCDRADGPPARVHLSNIVGSARHEEVHHAQRTQGETPFGQFGSGPSLGHDAVVVERWPSWWRWIWPLLGVFLALMLFSLLTRGCSMVGFNPPMPRLGGLIPELGVNIPEVALQRERALREEIADLGAGLDDRAVECLAPEEPDPEPVALTDEDDRLGRAGGERGIVNVSLQWNNTNDLDLIVVDPAGEKIFFGNRSAASGGFLDVDMNAGAQRSREPIENIRWSQNPPSGNYRANVMLYEIHERGGSDTRNDFVVTVTVFDERTEHVGTVLNRDRRQEIHVVDFAVP